MYKIRRAERADIPKLIELRSKMFHLVWEDTSNIEQMNRFSEPYFKEKIDSGEFVAWFAETDSAEVVACSALSFYYLTPKPTNLEGKYGYISSMYTEGAHRRRGLARRLLQTTLSYAREIGVTDIRLRASDDGRPLYESAGFRAWNEMGLALEEHPSKKWLLAIWCG